MNAKMTFKVVMPLVKKDCEVLTYSIEYLFRYLPVEELVIIGAKNIQQNVQELKYRISFINEDDMISKKKIEEIIESILPGDINAKKRSGWYLQQFLKMQYACTCNDEYYLIWDSDTIPIREVELFNENVPYMDMKKEYNKSYFETLKRLFPNLKKVCRGSFISEHMLIHTSSMKSLIYDIEANENIPGQFF